MNRRNALQQTALIVGGTICTSLVSGVLSGCTADHSLNWIPQYLTTNQARIVADLVERILPATQSPGAKEAKVDRFIDRMLHEYLVDPQRRIFIEGLTYLERQQFTKKSLKEQDQLVTELAESARQQIKNKGSEPFFVIAKQMTLLGFFTSEIGATQVLNYDPIPGGYQGCISLDEAGGKTWAL